MTHDELKTTIENKFNNQSGLHDAQIVNALYRAVELHRPYNSEDAPHEVAIGWCKGCSIGYSPKEYASHLYPCPTIQAIEKELI